MHQPLPCQKKRHAAHNGNLPTGKRIFGRYFFHQIKRCNVTARLLCKAICLHYRHSHGITLLFMLDQLNHFDIKKDAYFTLHSV